MKNIARKTLRPVLLWSCVALVACGLGTVKILTTSLPNGVVNQAYSQQLQGQHVDSWFIVDSTLPPGLKLSTSGLLSGTPTLAGTYTFTVEADQSGAYGAPSADQLLVIIISSS